MSLSELQEARELFVKIKSNIGDFMKSGDVSDELEEWTFLMYNFTLFGYDQDLLVNYLETSNYPNYWMS